MGVLYTVLGIIHFTNTGFYRPFMPKFLPAHDLLIYLSGIAEILLGIGVLFPSNQKSSSMGNYSYAFSVFIGPWKYAFPCQ